MLVCLRSVDQSINDDCVIQEMENMIFRRVDRNDCE